VGEVLRLADQRDAVDAIHDIGLALRILTQEEDRYIASMTTR